MWENIVHVRPLLSSKSWVSFLDGGLELGICASPEVRQVLDSASVRRAVEVCTQSLDIGNTIVIGIMSFA
jgi:hypothetical protein